ncbi:hypothetical protein [Paludisphaera soli]|uniref:hypothetical protein n=1 Tax=Paludisphaera soli TaxID=2712865 RepID=UPI0013EAB974|nr:hypothetical protein [Paludisphaera soli]
MERLTVLDVVALVMGSAVASIHIRPIGREGFSAPGLILASLAFAWLAATASGPFLYLARRFTGPTERSGIGERLWGLLGVPWLLSAAIRSAGSSRTGGAGDLDSAVLAIGLAAASTIAMLTVWMKWVTANPEAAREVASGPWPNRVGLALAIAWPLQAGLALMVLS